MPRRNSAGLLMYRIRDGRLEVLIVHPGGPYWAKKDAGSWVIPKGEVEAGEDEFAAAQREFQEETSVIPSRPFLDIGEVIKKSGKRVRAWAFAGDCEPAVLVSNTFEMEWPPRSGHMQSFPEVDRAEFADASSARKKLNPAEFEFVERLQKALEKELPAKLNKER
jgi:predicted NUDIX family NTP pyrophosphohydrolase